MVRLKRTVQENDLVKVVLPMNFVLWPEMYPGDLLAHSYLNCHVLLFHQFLA